MRFGRLIAIRLVSHDAEAMAGFYVAALGFELGATEPIAAAELALLGLTGTGTRTTLALAMQVVQIDQFDPPGRAYPLPGASDDRCFQHCALITHAMPDAWARVLAAGACPISPDGPVQLPTENGSVTAVKFRDPEGHPLELVAFPEPEAGAHRLAIDHSAIVVRDVAASLAFYEQCGLVLGDRTLNYGPAQAALDGLPEPRVDVVPLNPPGGGAHLELLVYADPAPRPQHDWQVRDVAATRLVWQAAEPALITDPDGHLHQCQPLGTPPASQTASG
jgi:catechol 2,3-dioxygenase-like lactoylglutathione lyase family enzyme